MSPSVPERCPWASPDGRHVLGLLEDYDTLCKQIGQGQKLLGEMEMDSRIQEAPSPSGQDLGSTVSFGLTSRARGLRSWY